ncbi:MAG: hypothetical protein WDN28_28225 [Chthoniobacter sp.]
MEISFSNGSYLLEKAGFHVLSTFDGGFAPADFGDTVHLTPAGGQLLAHLVADSVRAMDAAVNTPRRAMKACLRVIGSFAIGILFGVFFHYVLYRISLPGEPFIYFAF